MTEPITSVETLICPECGHHNDAGYGDGSEEHREFTCDNCGESFSYRIELVPIYHSWPHVSNNGTVTRRI